MDLHIVMGGTGELPSSHVRRGHISLYDLAQYFHDLMKHLVFSEFVSFLIARLGNIIMIESLFASG